MDLDTRRRIAKRAAQYFKSGDVVNLGVGIPSLCGDYAAEGVFMQTENGFIGVGATAEGLMATERSYNAAGLPFMWVPGSSAFDVAMSFGIIRSGRMAATVLGALQVDVNGNLANWATPVRAFGMGGAMDLVNGAKQVIVAMEHCDRNGNPKILNRCTLPLTGRKCVDHIVTDLCVIDVTGDGLVLREVAPGYTPEDVQKVTEPELIIAYNLKQVS